MHTWHSVGGSGSGVHTIGNHIYQRITVFIALISSNLFQLFIIINFFKAHQHGRSLAPDKLSHDNTVHRRAVSKGVQI